MEDFFNYLLENPYVLAIAAAIVFFLVLFAILKRLFTFVVTLVLLALAVGAGYAALYPKEAVHRVQRLFSRDEIKNTVEQLQQNVEQYKDKLTQ